MGLPTEREQKEFDDFNDAIWYGLEGQEMVQRVLGMSVSAKYCDNFFLRDFHNGSLMGFNNLKRATSTFSTVTQGNHCDGDAFNYVLRRKTAVGPAFQGKGYGKVIRKYSKYLDELHVGRYGVSFTGVQVKNTPSLNLQIASGFNTVTQMHTPIFHRFSFKIDPETLNHFNLYKVNGLNPSDREEFESLNVLHAAYLKRHQIIDLSLYPNAIYPGDALYVIKGKDASKPVVVFQSKILTAAYKTASKLESWSAAVLGTLGGFPKEEEEMEAVQLVPIHVDMEQSDSTLVDCIDALITFILKDNNASTAAIIVDVRNPLAKWMDTLSLKQKHRILGIGGALLTDENNMNLLMKFSGLSETQLSVATSNPIVCKPPLLLL